MVLASSQEVTRHYPSTWQEMCDYFNQFDLSDNHRGEVIELYRSEYYVEIGPLQNINRAADESVGREMIIPNIHPARVFPERIDTDGIKHSDQRRHLSGDDWRTFLELQVRINQHFMLWKELLEQWFELAKILKVSRLRFNETTNLLSDGDSHIRQAWDRTRVNVEHRDQCLLVMKRLKLTQLPLWQRH